MSIATLRAGRGAALCPMLASLCLGCAAGEPDTEPTSARSGTVQADAAPSAAVRKRQRGTMLGGEKVVRTLVWPAASEVVGLARDRYDVQARAEIERSPVPVLAPADPRARATVVVGAHWYAITVHDDDATIHVEGSGQARVYPHIKTFERTHPMRKGDGYLTRNEGVWSATWIENGAAYSFEVECAGDKRAWCEDESAVMAELESLVFLGGEKVRS